MKCIVQLLGIIETKNALSILYCYVEYEKEMYYTIVKHHWDKKYFVNIVLLRKILNCLKIGCDEQLEYLKNFYSY